MRGIDMNYYSHEQYRERDKLAPDNTVWPSMSTDELDVRDIRVYLNERGLLPELAAKNDWYPSRHANDNFLRIVIPALTTKEGHVYWQARAVSSNVHIRYQSPKGPRHGALINMRAFPDDVQGESTREVVIVEGPMDALAAAQCGVDAIALMGINPGTIALEHLSKLVNKRPALIVLDNEPHAQSQAQFLAMHLASAGSTAHLAKLHHVKDIATMKLTPRRDWLERCLEDLA